MRGRPKQPIDLVVANGRKNLSKAEIEKRKAEELVVPFKNITAPSYLPESLINEFDAIADKLLTLKIMTELDEDTLARYLLAKQQYLQLTLQLNKAMVKQDIDKMMKLQNMQDKAYKQCRAGASDLGLTITSRARLVVPDAQAPKNNKFIGKFGKNPSG